MGRILSLIGTILISSSIGFVASYLYSYNPEREIIAIEIISETGQQNQPSYLGGVVLSNSMSASGLDILEIAIASDDFDNPGTSVLRHELRPNVSIEELRKLDSLDENEARIVTASGNLGIGATEYGQYITGVVVIERGNE
jgi:hypothetical protein